MNLRAITRAAAAGLAFATACRRAPEPAARSQQAATNAPAMPAATVVVYKSPTCGCCARWIDTLRSHGFAVEVHDTSDLAPVLARYHVGPDLEACHTAIVGGYVVEGHVPADLIAKMLREKPAIAGLAVPGMPQSAPGMDNPGQPYRVLAFTADGHTSVYAER